MNKVVAINEGLPSALTPMDMLDRAVASNASVETLDKLMNLQERWEKNQARKAFDAAVSAAKAELKPVMRNRTGHNSKRYADFAAIAGAVDPVITKHGLSYRFRSDQGDRISVTCILSHKDGHYEQTTLSGPADTTGNKNAIQAIGSTLTYLQRYSLVQMLGLAAADDDDGKKSGKHTTVPSDVVDIIEYDEHGNPVDNIPRGDPSVVRLSKAMAKPDYALAQTEIRNMKTLAYLHEWGAANANRIESFPSDWQEMIRAEYRDKMLELGWKPKEKA